MALRPFQPALCQLGQYVYRIFRTGKGCGQCNNSAAKVKSLCEAQYKVCPAGLTAVCCLRISYPSLSKPYQLPDNCIVVLREPLKLFYGMFSDHPAATAHVNINECNRAQLTSLSCGSDRIERAVRLVWERVQEAMFESKAEFTSFLDDNGIEMLADDMADCVLLEEV